MYPLLAMIVFDLSALDVSSLKKIFKSNKWSPKYKNSDGFKKALKETYYWFEKEENLKKYTNIKNYNI